MQKLITHISVYFIIACCLSCTRQRYPNLDDGIYAEFITKQDTVVAKLFYENAPVTVANFIALSEGTHPLIHANYKHTKFYNGTTFHRVVPNFIAQAGKVPIDSIPIGFTFGDELTPHLKHDTLGVLAMANSGFNTNASQFYFTKKPTPWLDGYDQNNQLKNCESQNVYCHSVFGKVISNTNALDGIKQNDPLFEVNIIRKGFNAKRFNAPKIWKLNAPNLNKTYIANKAKQKNSLKQSNNTDSTAVDYQIFTTQNIRFKKKSTILPNGVAIYHLNKSHYLKPKFTDFISLNITGYLEDGNCFYTNIKTMAIKHNIYSYSIDKLGGYQPEIMVFNKSAAIIPGLKSAILKLRIGDKARVFIPAHLAYASQGLKNVVPPNSNLVYDIELLEIIP